MRYNSSINNVQAYSVTISRPFDTRIVQPTVESLYHKENFTDISSTHGDFRYEGMLVSIIGDRSKYSWEHIVPTKVLIDEVKSLYASKKLTQRALRSIIDKYGTVCIISKSEDDKLTKNKLRSKMPPGWKFGDSAFSRYVSVGIVLK